jgi:hypothetical protein
VEATTEAQLEGDETAQRFQAAQASREGAEEAMEAIARKMGARKSEEAVKIDRIFRVDTYYTRFIHIFRRGGLERSIGSSGRTRITHIFRRGGQDRSEALP